MDQPLTYGIIGGKIDNDEVTFEQAAIREFKEETDYDGNIDLEDLLFNSPRPLPEKKISDANIKIIGKSIER